MRVTRSAVVIGAAVVAVGGAAVAGAAVLRSESQAVSSSATPSLSVAFDQAPQAKADALPEEYLRGREDLKLRVETARLVYENAGDKVWYVESAAQGQTLRCIATQTGIGTDLTFSTSCKEPKGAAYRLGTLQEVEGGPVLVVGFVPDGFSKAEFNVGNSTRTVTVNRNVVAFRVSSSSVPTAVRVTGLSGSSGIEVTR